MAIDWASGTGLFDKLGKLVHVVDLLDTQEAPAAESFVNEINEFIAKLGSEDDAYRDDVIQLSEKIRGGYISNKTSIISFLVQLLNVEIIDAENLGSYKTSALELIRLLRYYMGRDGKVLDTPNIPTIGGSADGTATAITTPANSGILVIPISTIGILTKGVLSTPTKTLNFATHNNAQPEESIRPDTYMLTCISDSIPGAEVLSLEGTKLPLGVYSSDWKHGNAAVIQVSSANNNNNLSNGGFETTSGSGSGFAVSDWTFEAGTPGTDIIGETVDRFRDNRSLKLVRSSTDPKISQTVTLSGFSKHLLALAYKRTVAGASGTLKMYLTGSGFSTDPSEEISVSLTSTDASWVRVFKWVNVPSILPSSMKVVIETVGAASGVTVLIDEAVLVKPVRLQDGLSICALANRFDGTNNDNPRLNDKWTFTISNPMTGKFQRFFGRFFNYSLPAASGGAHADRIPDSLAG